MSDNFWHDLPQPFFMLAPMEAVTDVIFRHVITAAAPPDVLFTEFTNTNSWCSPKGQHSTKGRLAFTDDEQPIVAHIWGDVPEYYAEMSRDMAKMGYKGIDINMGCPAPNVASNGCGSGLIKHPDTAAAVIAAAKHGGLPVSVKTRLGYSYLDEWRDWLGHLLRQDIANLTIHLRTKKEMSKVPAHYELIADIVKLRDEIAPHTLLTINGDIKDRAHGLELVRDNPGVNGVMIGRGVFHNPFAFRPSPMSSRPDVETSAATFFPDGAREKSGAKPLRQQVEATLGEPTQTKELIDLLRLHLDLYDQYAELTRRPFDTLKRFFKIYVRDFDGAAELRDKLMHTKSTDEVRELLSR